jgi:drug/metabolite transporter (DMT)-like permease
LADFPKGRTLPYAVAVVVTVLWSSSFVLIKLGLEEVPPVYFATLRYALAFAVLAIVDLVRPKRQAVGGIGGGASTRSLIFAGIFGYTIAQGFEYVGLFFLPAVSAAFILTFNPIFVLFIGLAFLGESAGRKELVGLLVALAGAFLFFYGRIALEGEWLGVFITVVSGIGWAAYVILIRGLQRQRTVDSLRLTTLTMGVGVVGMVALSAATGEYSPLSMQNLVYVVWLATANTALAFFLWNWSLTAIPAYHLTVLQNVMLVEIALFSLAFLGEALTPVMIAGMALVLVGVVVVQLRGRLDRV